MTAIPAMRRAPGVLQARRCTSMPSAGYTLIELLTVLALLALLAMMVMPVAELTMQRDKEKELKRGLWEIRAAIDAYKKASDAGLIARPEGRPGYPPTLDVLVEGVPDPRVPGQRLYFLRRLPRDPFATESVPAAETWATRGYDSAPDKPVPGVDVFDVQTLSKRTGLNGIPLREW